MKSRLLSRLVLLVAIVIAAASVISTGVRITYLPSAAAARARVAAAEPGLLPGRLRAGGAAAYASVVGFARVAGKRPNLVGYYSGWAAPFAASFAQQTRAHGAIPYVQIDPTDASVSAIARGTYDIYLRQYADSVRDFGHAVVIGFGHEMNSPRYSWGYGHVQPSTFVTAWRHIVTLFRGEGADNVTWLWTVNQDGRGTGPVAAWWPGANYVTWVGIDGYYFRPADTFASVFGLTIAQVRVFTDKPILLSETAVGPAAGQFAKIGNLFDGMRRYKTLGLVWFDIPQHEGIFHQDWRIEGRPAAEAAFRRGIFGLALARPSR